MNVPRIVFRILPFRCRYWGMPWHTAQGRVEKKEWRFQEKNRFFETEPTKEYVIHIRLYSARQLVTIHQYQLTIGYTEGAKIKRGDNLTVEYRESRIPDPLSGEKTIQIRLPPVPQRCKDENMDRPHRPGQSKRRPNRQE